MSGLRRILGGAVLAAAAASLWWWLAAGAGAGAGTVTASREDFRVLVEAGGNLEAAVFYELGPPSVKDFWNYNLTWIIPEGSRVKEGQVVARFDAQQMEEQLRDFQAELETVTQEKEKEQRQLEIQLKQLRLDLVEARAEVEKVAVEASVPEELVPALELAQTRRRRQLAEERVRFLEEKTRFEQELVRNKLELLDVKKERARQKIEYFQEARDKFSVKAPIEGVVIYVPKPNGNRWEVGEGVWMMAKVLKVADISTLRVEAQVLEVDAARIATGQPASVTVDALPGLVVQTEVAEIGRIVHERTPQDPTKVFDVFLPLERLEEGMRPGMSVGLSIEVERFPGGVTVPVDAILALPGGTYVDRLDDAGGSRRMPVVLGPRHRDRVLVLEGLDGGERLRLPDGEAA